MRRRLSHRPARLALAGLAAALGALAAAPAPAGDSTDPGAPWPTQVDLPRATGMGGSMISFASGNDAMTVNPAGVGLNHTYHFELDGMDDKKFPAEGVIFSVADSTTLGIGSGLMFERWGAGQPGGRSEGWLGGLSYAYGSGAFLAGGTTHLIHFNEPDGVQVRTFTEDFGFMAHAGSWNFGLVLQNFSFTFDKVPLFPLTSGAGFSYGTDLDWHLSVDYKMNMNDFSNLKHLLAFGGEYVFDRTFALRAGYRWDITNHLGWITWGASVITDRIGIHFAMRRRVEGAMEQTLEAGISVYLE